MAKLDFAPGLANLSSYRPAWLRQDVVAGLVLTALLVPQGMAYAELAGLPPITGLYTSILCLVAYAIFGPSKILVLGPDSSLGPMIAATIIPLAGAKGDPARAVALASELAHHGVSLVGVLPKGFPPFTVPDVHLADAGLLIGGALGIALVSLTDTISTASSFAARSGEEVDGGKEMIGIGAANLAAGLFQG